MDAKACLRALTLELRHELEGSYDREGAWKPGDLEVRLAIFAVLFDEFGRRAGELESLFDPAAPEVALRPPDDA